MTRTNALHVQHSNSSENAVFLHAGYIHESVPPGTAATHVDALMLGGLQVLAAMLVLGDSGEKTFARKKLKKCIATGKRLSLAVAKKAATTYKWKCDNKCGVLNCDTPYGAICGMTEAELLHDTHEGGLE
jgi:hypothetical protein